MSEMSSFDNNSYVREHDDNFSVDANANSKDVEETKENRRDVDSMTEDEIKKEKFAIMKNVILLSFAFLLLFTAFQSMSALQSSINKVCNLGTYSNSVIYASLVLSCMFLPSFLIKKCTVKWSLVMCMCCYSLYMAVQFYPEFYTLIPGAIVVGIGAAPMWSAKCTYLTQVGARYADLTKVDVEPIIVRFFGIFFMFFQSSSIWGPLISAEVLKKDKEEVANHTVDLSKCGIYYCPAPASCEEDEVDEQFKVDKSDLYTIAGVYLASSILAILVAALLVDPLSRFGESNEKGEKTKLSGGQLFVATFRHMRNHTQIFIIPLTMWSGIEQGFFFADYTAGFVTCVMGVHYVGYVFITYGICDASCSVTFGAIIKKVGRVTIFIFGALINLTVIMVMFLWSPKQEQAYVFFILAALWGIADAVWQTQINALYGYLFYNDEEAAFSNYRLWESIGFILAFILQTQVCIYSKLWVLIVAIIVGMAGYLTVEVIERRKDNEESQGK